MSVAPVKTPAANLRRFWRVPVVAVLGAVLGFGGSYLFGVSYAAGTRLLIRVNNTSFLTDTGSTLVGQPAAIDQAGLAKAVADTQSSLLTNNVVATMVVNQLNLAAPVKSPGGPVTWMKNVIKNVIAYTESYLIHGTYKKLNAYDKAVQDVQKGLSAGQLTDSYMLGLVGKGKTPLQARQITDAAADDLVQIVDQQFRADVTANTQHLSTQVAQAARTQQAAAAALAAFDRANGVNATLSLTDPTTQQSLMTAVAGATVDVAAAQAALQASEDALAKTPTTSALYGQLQVAVYGAQSTLASVQAREATLQTAMTTGLSPALSAAKLAQYQQLQQQYTTDQSTYTALQGQYQASIVNQASSPAQLTRIDRAVATVYPVAPKRYLYLGIGLIIGLVAGFLLTARSAWRRGETLFPHEDDLVLAAPARSVATHNGDTVAAEEIIELDEPGVVRRIRVGAYEVFGGGGPAGWGADPPPPDWGADPPPAGWGADPPAPPDRPPAAPPPAGETGGTASPPQ